MGTKRTTGIDVAIAILIAGAMAFAWSLRDWADLSVLRLPDTDDMMRLQQVRDWMAGQGWGDLAQHRLAGGLPMHWSRLGDLGPAALIALARPWVGAATAERVAVLVWPALNFLAAMLLIRTIARDLAGGTAGRVAMVLTALAYPMTTVFLPGRIDHHATQIVLVLALVLAVIRPAGVANGVAMGLATALSLAIGLEFAPLLAAVLAAVALLWVLGTPGATARLAGLGAGLASVTCLLIALARPAVWPSNLCDGFTAASAFATLIGAAALIGMAALTPVLTTDRLRGAAGGAVGMTAAMAIAWRAPACLAPPYGGVDPLVARLWLHQVVEAQPLTALPPGIAIGYAGLLLAGLGATAWCVKGAASHEARTGWLVLLALQALAAAMTLVEVRAAHVGAALALPALAASVAAIRTRAPAVAAFAWLGSAGIAYALAGQAVGEARAAPGHTTPVADCTTPAALRALHRLPRGRLMAPIDMGAYALAATPVSVVAAPYHRNNAGNAAMYRFFLSDDADARRIAAAWQVTSVAWCDGGLGPAAPAGRLARQLQDGRAPAWLRPIDSDVPGLHLFVVAA